ncbi:MAG: site-2 protease family protein [Phycisphaerales bacterium]
MTPTRQGSVHLFRLAGIDLYLHWTWFLVAWYGISQRVGWYTSPIWNVLEYLSLFAIVLMHEFGHSLACRQVGGQADQIVLWPLGGVAYVQPPQRPGAVLWSLAAGPLVNVVLVPVLFLLSKLMQTSGVLHAVPDLYRLLRAVAFINLGLLIFNLLPIYPLDGGQIVRSLLWFVVGRAWSMTIATVLGFVGVVGLVVLAVWSKSIWLGVLSGFILLHCWRGLQYGLRLVRVARAPRRAGFACPICGAAPPAGKLWTCPGCRKAFDIFEAEPICPECGTIAVAMRCLECGDDSPIHAWRLPAEPRMDAIQSPVDTGSA